MEEKPDFYELDKSRPYKAEGAVSFHFSKILIIFSSVYIVGVILFTVINLIINIDIFEEFGATLAPVFLFVLGMFFLSLGIIFRIKDKKLKKREEEILKNCVLTDGRITEYSCVQREYRDSDGTNVNYEVELKYTFYDKDLTVRSGKYCGTYGYDPEFYKGQYLMIAFNENDSLILKLFTVKKSDEKKFLANEARRSDDYFDGLTGELLDVDVKKPIKDYEYSIVWFWAAFALFVFLAAYTIPIGIIVVPQILSIKFIVPEIFAIVGIFLLPVILAVAIIALLCGFVKRHKKFKKIISGNPFFTFGKMFASEKTYRGGLHKKVFYCYIDKWGEKHTETVTSPPFHKKIQDENLDVVVAYDAAGNSTVILSCKLMNEE